jgi:rhodanese-related sulfurtransferase
MTTTRRFIAGIAGVSLLLASCGDDDAAGPAAEAAATDQTSAEAGSSISGISTVSADEAAAIVADPPEGLVVLDVRTPEEFAEGHLADAVLVDFYDADFADQLAALDTDVPYLVYCRSGNRSGETLDVMRQLGFRSAVDVGGGILAWASAGLPVTTG